MAKTTNRFLFSQVGKEITKGLDYLFPSKKRLFLFGANAGHYYADNSRYLYEWVLRNEPEITAVWMTKNTKIYHQLKSEGKPVEKVRSVAGMSLLLQADVGFFTHSMADIAPDTSLTPQSLDLVYLRHGEPVKNTHLGVKNSELITNDEQFQSERWREYDVSVICTSAFIANAQRDRLGVTSDQQIVSGYPRHDPLFDGNFASNASSVLTHHVEFDMNEVDQIGLYAPTWRQYNSVVNKKEHTEFFPFDGFKLSNVDKLLEESNSAILLRPHPHDLQYESVQTRLNELKNSVTYIDVLGPEKLHDVYQVLPYLDFLITDYSSLYHDFLILDKPMLFVPYDLSLFKQNVGFIYDYEANLPGPLIESWTDFQHEFQNITNNSDDYEQKRASLRDLVYDYQDGNASKRIIHTLKNSDSLSSL